VRCCVFVSSAANDIVAGTISPTDSAASIKRFELFLNM
jgi:hypothetical protein